MAIPLLARLAGKSALSGSGTGPINVSLKADLDKLKRQLTRQQRDQVPFATSMALNNVAGDVANAITVQMDRYLNKPTPFTQKAYQYKANSFRGKRADKRTLTVIIEPAKIQEAYLKFQIAGGTRTPKNRMILVPTKQAPLNNYGNLSRAVRKKLITAKKQYFAVGTRENRTPAIYKREGRRITPMGFYVDQAEYKPIFPVQKIAAGVAANRFPRRFAEAMRRAMATAR
jgi:hypothetical protein